MDSCTGPRDQRSNATEKHRAVKGGKVARKIFVNLPVKDLQQSMTFFSKLGFTFEAGTAFDGRHLFQLAENLIQKIDPKTGRVIATIPAPGGGGDSGLAWAEGTLWVGNYRDRKIHQVDPETGQILRTIKSNRFVTGVTWIDGELWRGTWEGDESELRRVDQESGEVLQTIEMPPGVGVSGLESNGGEQFFCGGGRSGKVRAVRRPRRGSMGGSAPRST
jgi:outer membrane protein assembly factor BamB